MCNDKIQTERDMPGHVIRRIAMEVAARMLFRQEAETTAISLAVAHYVWDLRAARECRGTLVEVESTWIPAGKEQEAREASEAIMDAVGRHLRDYMAENLDL
ncbi:hypothetical protein Tamer19_38610 [Cupriavidus sp. TA19]|uniref:hypothetical protein n=1 Tax=unclassified Cupriavidus TaxID=2640874 RepID=UPI0027294011|nr:hypothetical protein [Cupriavidus sp. TA19]GLC94453.1 hypothetical protein Tamer19_38610 [Cupriavidus sp. TA19]